MFQKALRWATTTTARCSLTGVEVRVPRSRYPGVRLKLLPIRQNGKPALTKPQVAGYQVQLQPTALGFVINVFSFGSYSEWLRRSAVDDIAGRGPEKVR